MDIVRRKLLLVTIGTSRVKTENDTLQLPGFHSIALSRFLLSAASESTIPFAVDAVQ